ncbi:MAG: sporulation protein YunB [Clostridia bacterium]|nr:sporulation protein YunB [Clostridia bacterium]
METEVLKRKKKRPGRKRVPALALAAALAAGALAVMGLVYSAVRRPLIVSAVERVREEVSRELTAACAEALEGEPSLVPDLTREQTEEALVIEVDAAGLNALLVRAGALAQERVSGLCEDGVSLELGAATGLPSLPGRGIRVSAGFAPMGSVSAEAHSGLRSSGINQTLFSVDVTLKASLRVFVAGAVEEIDVSGTMPVCRTVIVGSVPQVYTNVADEEDMLNLIPTDLP